jgi:hypothetical protein
MTALRVLIGRPTFFVTAPINIVRDIQVVHWPCFPEYITVSLECRRLYCTRHSSDALVPFFFFTRGDTLVRRLYNESMTLSVGYGFFALFF